MRDIRITALLPPFLFAVYPVAALLARNLEQVPIIAALRPAVLSLLFAGFAFCFFWALRRNTPAAVVAATIAIVLLSSYGHIYDGLKLIGLSGTHIVRHRYVLPVFVAVLTGGIYIAFRARVPHKTLYLMNLVAVLVLAFPLTMIAKFQAQEATGDPAFGAIGRPCTLSPSQDVTPPDIYLIIMDAYERDDILREMHGFDNTPFLGQLEDMGFYIAHGSLSNYRFTVLSLASLLNMDYIQGFPDRYDPGSQNRWGIAQMIRGNRVRHELECIGYHVVAVETGVYWTDWPDADYYFSVDEDPFHSLKLLGAASRFEALLLDTNIARVALDLIRTSQARALPAALDPTSMHRERILFAFEQLKDIPSLPSAKFVFIHILSPHPPMVFGQEGELSGDQGFESKFAAVSNDEPALKAYARQVDYLNERLIEVVHSIISQSEQPPIIMITADHGWADRNPEDKLSILHAYFLPEGGDSMLYPTITPVNAFRVVLDQYLGGGLGLLEDASYYSTLDDVFDFEEIENTWVRQSH